MSFSYSSSPGHRVHDRCLGLLVSRGTKRTSIAALIVLTGLAGCEQKESGIIDTTVQAPVLSSASLVPSSVNIDTIPPSGGSYTVSAIVSLAVSDPIGPGNLERVWAAVSRPRSSDPFVEVNLHDDGIIPDTSSGDGVFSALLSLQLTRPQTGRYTVSFIARNRQGAIGVILQKSFLVTRNNSRPELSNLHAPDSVQIPVSPQDTVNVLFYVTAADSDGLADIQQVLLSRIEPPSSARIPLRDDGSLGPPFNFADTNGVLVPRRSGDLVAGDGVFTLTVPLLFSSTARTNLFGLQAIDSFGDTSAMVLHYTTFYRK
jgi:hypothetical protein